MNWVQKETIHVGELSGTISNKDIDQEERNQSPDSIQGVTYLKPSNERSAEADTVKPLQSNAQEEEDKVEGDDPLKRRTDSASPAADIQSEALGRNFQSGGDWQQKDDPGVPGAQADAKRETLLEKTSMTVTATVTTADGKTSVDSADRVKHPLDDVSSEEKSRTEIQPQANSDDDGEESSEEENDGVDEKQEMETDEKDKDQKKSSTGGDSSKQSKRTRKRKKRKRNRNNNAQSSQASSELPLPTPASDDQSQSSPQKQQVSYAGAVKSGANGQRDRNVNILNYTDIKEL